MPIFIDLMYPDNANRKKRLDELTNDCQLYMNDTADKANQISAAVEKSNKIIIAAYKAIAKAPPALTRHNIVSDTTLAIVETIAGLVSIPIAASFMKWAFSTYLLRIGKITTAQLLEVGASKLIKIHIGKFFRIAGGIGATILVTLAIESIVDAIEGAVQRKQLQDAIEDLVPQRVSIKKAYCVNDLIYQNCSAAAIAYEVFVEMGTYTSAELDNIAKSIVKKHEAKIDSITDAFVKDKLRTLDTGRNSWTKEDRSGYETTQRNALPFGPAAVGLSFDARQTARETLLGLDCIDAEKKQRVENYFKRNA